MKHLFIINPVAYRVKRRVNTIKKNIDTFFKDYPGIEYEIFVTKWSRDAVSYIRKYISKRDEQNNNDIIRVHSLGGTGTFFEVVSGVVGLKNVEIASYPYGKGNVFLRYFDPDYKKMFYSLKAQVFSTTIPMDVITNGNHYGVCNAILGLEARASVLGYKIISRGVPMDIGFLLGAAGTILGGNYGQRYNISIDNKDIDGEYTSILIANVPCYSIGMYPAVDAHPDDGVLDIYLFKKCSRTRLLRSMLTYAYGNYQKLPDLCTHYTGRKFTISSDETIFVSIDGESLYTMSGEYEVVPGAVQFAVPGEIDLTKLPKIFNNPKEGLRNA